MLPESAALVWDALDAASSIAKFLDGITVEQYLVDPLRRRAVEREFEIVGEALGRLRRVDPGTAARVPGLGNAVGMRNVLIHGYAEVVDERVFDTAMLDLPGLVDVLSALMSQVEQP